LAKLIAKAVLPLAVGPTTAIILIFFSFMIALNLIIHYFIYI